MATKFQEWCVSLKPARKRPEKVHVTRTKNDDDDLLVYKPIFIREGGRERRAVSVGKMKRRKQFRQPACPIFTNELEDEGIALLLELAPSGYDYEYPCQLCGKFLFPNEGAYRGYLAEKLEGIVLRPPDSLEGLKWRRLCRFCRKFQRVWYWPAMRARGELRVRLQLTSLSQEQQTAEIAAFKKQWTDAFVGLRDELKKAGALPEVRKKYREVANKLMKEVAA